MQRDLFVPSIWDRLMAAGKTATAGASQARTVQPIAQLRAAIARDLVIQATIKGHALAPKVKFNAMLQPSTLQYAISEARARSVVREPTA